MSAYRKRFVQFTMLLIGFVLTAMVAAVAVYLVRDYYNGLRVTMEQVVAPLRELPRPPEGEAPRDAPEPEARRREKDILALIYDPEDETYSVLSSDNPYSDAELRALLSDVAAQSEPFGVLRARHVFYYRSESAPYRVAIASTAYLTHSVVNLGLVLLASWLGAMLLLLAVSIRLSAIAARPMEEAIRREKQFVADASHDLKTPLSVILANTAILAESPEADAEGRRRWLESTQTATKRMQRLICRMLTLAEAERPEAAPAMQPVELCGLATKAALELESMAYERHVALETELPASCTVRADPDELLRVISSLLDNALKYEPEGGRVLLSLVRERRRASLTVRNFGSCIPEEELPHVFDRFYRGDKSRAGEDGSFGLGLAIAKEMTERMGGRLSAESSPQEGTCFRLSLGLGK